MQTTLHAAIFDLDGTILDSGAMWDGVAPAVVRRFGYTPKETICADTLPLGMGEFAPFLKADYGMSESLETIGAAIEELVARYYLGSPALKLGALAFLRRLKAAGVPMAVATATERRFAEPALRSTGALELLDAVLTCPEVGAGKRRPDIFRQAARALGVRQGGAWVFEDALYAMETAKADGFPVCAVADPAAQFQMDEIRQLADCFLPDFLHWQSLPFAGRLA